jgi:hypothetical protein
MGGLGEGFGGRRAWGWDYDLRPQFSLSPVLLVGKPFDSMGTRGAIESSLYALRHQIADVGLVEMIPRRYPTDDFSVAAIETEGHMDPAKRGTHNLFLWGNRLCVPLFVGRNPFSQVIRGSKFPGRSIRWRHPC